MANDDKIGPTGEFPEGKITAGDEGSIRIRVETHKENVVVHFGKPVGWIGMTPNEAEAFAELILKHARSLRH